MQRTLRRIAAGLICTILLGSGAVFAEEETTTQAASTTEMKAVVLQAGQDSPGRASARHSWTRRWQR